MIEKLKELAESATKYQRWIWRNGMSEETQAIPVKKYEALMSVVEAAKELNSHLSIVYSDNKLLNASVSAQLNTELSKALKALEERDDGR